jgi:hypothetical protein
MEIYMAGQFSIAHIEYGITQHVFVLISQNGVPGIIYWREKEAVTNYILMAPAAQVSLYYYIFYGTLSIVVDFRQRTTSSSLARTPRRSLSPPSNATVQTTFARHDHRAISRYLIKE